MKIILLLVFLFSLHQVLTAQNSADSLSREEGGAAADDPSQFFNRIEFFNDLQQYKNNVYLNQTVLRTTLKIGKRFTTRLDIPFIYNSIETAAGYNNFGLGDISFRLLGYKIAQDPKSALTASIEISLNTASSPILGTGKNLIIPVVSYSKLIPSKKILFALVFQQANAVSGDDSRPNVSFSKIQFIVLKTWNKKIWTSLAPEWYIDYVNGGVSMNVKGRAVTPVSRHVQLWAAAGAGIFGDFIGRYQWSAELGSRYFLIKSQRVKKQ